MDLVESLLESRWAIFADVGASIPRPFLAILVFWLTMIFASYGLFAPRNATVVSVLFLCAVSVAGAIFLVLEMNDPFAGLISISPDPVLYAFDHLNQ